MNPEQYWNIKMTQYITRFNLFRKMLQQTTGITDEELIQEHWNLFADNLCGCGSCSEDDEDDTIEINVPSNYIANTNDDDDEDWDDESPTWN